MAPVRRRGSRGRVSQSDETVIPSGLGTAHCYEIQIESNGSDPNKTGSLIVMPPIKGNPQCLVRLSSPPPANRWFTMETIVNDYHITVIVDGKKVIDFEDKDRRFAKGEIGLQLHHPGTVVQFRKVQVKDLPAR